MNYIKSRNKEIRESKGKVPNWAIAERIGVSENTLLRWMRQEIEGDRKIQILNAIADIKKRGIQ